MVQVGIHVFQLPENVVVQNGGGENRAHLHAPTLKSVQNAGCPCGIWSVRTGAYRTESYRYDRKFLTKELSGPPFLRTSLGLGLRSDAIRDATDTRDEVTSVFFLDDAIFA